MMRRKSFHAEFIIFSNQKVEKHNQTLVKTLKNTLQREDCPLDNDDNIHTQSEHS
jgi:hypothetical protein